MSTTNRLRNADRGDRIRVIDEASGRSAEGESYEEDLAELGELPRERNDVAAAIRALEGSDESMISAFREMTRNPRRRIAVENEDPSVVDEAIEWARSR